MWIDDDVLRRYKQQLVTAVYYPQQTVVVLGNSNKADVEVNAEACQRDGVEILKRYGGGGTVVLYPGSLVVSVGAWVGQPFQNSQYFDAINGCVIKSLGALHPDFCQLSVDGLSDIVFGERKVAGTSMFRSRNYLLYQASILVELDIDLIGRYLKHPSKEPAYRKKRSHRDFLTSLCEMAPQVQKQLVMQALEQNLARELENSAHMDLIAPQERQFKGLESRLLRSSDGEEFKPV